MADEIEIEQAPRRGRPKKQQKPFLKAPVIEQGKGAAYNAISELLINAAKQQPNLQKLDITKYNHDRWGFVYPTDRQIENMRVRRLEKFDKTNPDDVISQFKRFTELTDMIDDPARNIDNVDLIEQVQNLKDNLSGAKINEKGQLLDINGNVIKLNAFDLYGKKPQNQREKLEASLPIYGLFKKYVQYLRAKQAFINYSKKKQSIETRLTNINDPDRIAIRNLQSMKSFFKKNIDNPSFVTAASLADYVKTEKENKAKEQTNKLNAMLAAAQKVSANYTKYLEAINEKRKSKFITL